MKSLDALEYGPFGEVLKAFRKKRKISQQTLSEKLGVHFNTISKWERGICLPDSRGMVLEVAKQLRLNEPETRQLLEASLTALSTFMRRRLFLIMHSLPFFSKTWAFFTRNRGDIPKQNHFCAAPSIFSKASLDRSILRWWHYSRI
jgi:transcriptional regulator with XRE-family HTH domain